MNGNVGIGTTSPAFSAGSGLRIERDATATLRLQDTGANGFEIRASSTAAEFFNANSKPFTFETGGSEVMRINSSGNVGIGTDSPSAVGSRTTLNISGSAGAAIRLSDGTANTFLDYTDGSGARLSVNAAEPLTLRTNSSDRVTIDGSGNVGIGTTSPTATLSVIGNQLFDGTGINI